MEESDRKKILDNINALIKHTKYDKLVEKCLPPLLFPHMIEQIEVGSTNQFKSEFKSNFSEITNFTMASTSHREGNNSGSNRI